MPESNGEHLGEALRRLRVARGLRLEDAAIRGGFSKSALSAWENGSRRPRGPALLRLLESLGADDRTKARLLHLAQFQQSRLVLAESRLGPPVSVGEIVRALRLRRGISQEELARRVGVSQVAVSRWEAADDIPSTETIHQIGFSLEATAEEAIALASAGGTTRSGLGDDPEAVLRQVSARHGTLDEVISLGRQAELYRRAQSDPRWEEPLISLLSMRADSLVREERFTEVPEIAGRAIRLARTVEGRWHSAPAVAALADAERHLGRGHATAADLATAWSDALPKSDIKAWMIRQRGMSLVRMGRVAEGLDLVARSVEMDLEATEILQPWSHRTSMLCEALVAAGEVKAAADLIGGRRETEFWPALYMAIEHAHGRAVSPAEMEYTRYWVDVIGPAPMSYRRLHRLERRQAQLRGEDDAPHEAGTYSATDPDQRERLWQAVLREHPG